MGERDHVYVITVKDKVSGKTKALSFRSEYSLAWFVTALREKLEEMEWIKW